MAAMIYESKIPWDRGRPDTVIISCVDGRWRAQIQDFTVNYLKADLHADFLAVPGGIEPLTLFDLVPKDFNFFRRRLESLIEAHGTKRIVAIAHQDCAWYKQRKFLSFKIDLRERQISDLLRVAARLKEAFPELTIETYFARLEGKDPERVVFERV
jgi:carbonic anhydrase